MGDRTWEAHKAATFNLNEKVWNCAVLTKNEPLKRKFLDGDMIARDAEYHLKCLSKLYREAQSCERGTYGETQKESEKREIVFHEIIDYLEMFRESATRVSMSSIMKLYKQRLELQNLDSSGTHTTRLRKSILDAIPDIKEVRHDNGTYDLIYDNDLSAIVKELKDVSVNEKISLFLKVARLIRQEVLEKKHEFKGNFNPNSEKDSVSESLCTLLRMVLDGPSFLTGERSEDTFSSEPIVLSLAQQIAFNTVEKRALTGKYVRHSKEKTTPLPTYVGIKSYLQGKKVMIDMLYSRGVSISYDMVKNLSMDIANSVIKFWDNEGIIVPPQAKKGRFTIIGFDNIDWNAKSKLSRTDSTLHGTIIVVHQFGTNDSPVTGDQNVNILDSEVVGLKKVKRLPHDYANVDDKYSIGKNDNLIVPKISKHIDSFEGSVSHLISEEYAWLKDSLRLILNESLEKSDWHSWAAYHASHNITNFVTRMISHVMPILLQKSSDPATIAHVLRIACGLIKHLNPGQIVMVETDQPLYQTAKKLRWKYPEEIFSEDHLFLSLGIFIQKKCGGK